LVFAKKKLRPVQPGNPLMPANVDTEYWFTGDMIESVELYEGIPKRKGRLTAETIGKEVCLVPEVRHLPRREKQFTAFYTVKENTEDGIEEDILSRSEHYRSKGWLPLRDCTEEIQGMIKIMHKHNEKIGASFVAGKEKYVSA